MLSLSCYLLLAALLAVSAVADDDTGLTKLVNDDDTRCSEQVLTYVCVTAGKGATEVTLNNMTLLRFPHGQFIDGANVNLSRLDGNVTGGHLSQSQTKRCVDILANRSSSFCYRTVINVHLADQTRCMTIGCRTITRMDGMDRFVYFGDATIARGPPSPKNVRIMTQSVGAVTFIWDPGSMDCSEAKYSVQTSNCGNCDSRSRNTTYRNITCSELVPEQQCRIFVQSVLECGVLSDPATTIYEVPAVSPSETTTTAEATVNVSAAVVGAIVGSVVAVFFGVIIIIIVVAIVGINMYIRSRKRGSVDLLEGADSTERSNSKKAKKDTSTKPSHAQEAKQEVEVTKGHDDLPKVDNVGKVNESTVEDAHALDTKPLLSSPCKNGQSSTCTTETTTQELMPLHQISNGSSSAETTADGDGKPLIEAESNLQNDNMKTSTSQSSEDFSAEVAEESSTDVNLNTNKFVAISNSQTKNVHNGVPSPRLHVIDEDPHPPSTSTTRGMEPVFIGLQPTLESFRGRVGDEGEFEESREKTSGAETVYSQDPPKKSNGYGLSEKRKLLSQETSNDDKEPTTPVPTTDNEDSAPKFAGITQYSNVAGSSQMANFEKRLEDLEHGREEQGKELKEHKKEIEEQKEEIKEQKEEIKELKTDRAKQNSKIDTLTTELKKCQEEMNKLKLETKDLREQLLDKEMKNDKLCKELENKEKRIKELELKNLNLVRELDECKKKLQEQATITKQTSLGKQNSRPELCRFTSSPNP